MVLVSSAVFQWRVRPGKGIYLQNQLQMSNSRIILGQVNFGDAGALWTRAPASCLQEARELMWKCQQDPSALRAARHQ